MSHTEDDQRAGWIDRFVELFSRTLGYDTACKLYSSIIGNLSIQANGRWRGSLGSTFRLWMSLWRSLGINLKASKTNGSNGFHVSFREGMFMVFVHLFWQNIPPQLATCSLGGYCNRRDEFNRTNHYKSTSNEMSFAKKHITHLRHIYP